MALDLENKKLELEILKLERDRRIFKPKIFIEVLIAAAVLFGTVWVIPDGFVSTVFNVKDHFKDQYESGLDKIKKLQSENKILVKKLEVTTNDYAKRLDTNNNDISILKRKLESLKRNNQDLQEIAKISKSNNLLQNKLIKNLKELKLLKESYESLHQENSEVKERNENLVAEEIKISSSFRALREIYKSKLVILSVAKEILGDGGYYSGSVYFAELPDSRKLINISEAVKVQKESIIAFIDTTIMGTATNGFVYTKDFLYFSDDGVTGKISFANFNENSISKTGRNSLDINGQKVTVISGDLTPEKIINSVNYIVDKSKDLDRI